jgi:DNA-binding transcriptional ArsR family regulator
MTADSKEAPVDQRLIKALGHPVRLRVLDILNARVASPSELAKELEEPLGNVAYHVKILEETGSIELVRTAPVRGALEHFYRATTDVSATWLDLDDEACEEVTGSVQALVARAEELEKEAAPRLAGRAPSERHSTALMIMRVHRAPAEQAEDGEDPTGG